MLEKFKQCLIVNLLLGTRIDLLNTPYIDKVDDEFEQLVTGLYENTMKKSELKRIIREEMGLPHHQYK